MARFMGEGKTYEAARNGVSSPLPSQVYASLTGARSRTGFKRTVRNAGKTPDGLWINSLTGELKWGGNRPTAHSEKETAECLAAIKEKIDKVKKCTLFLTPDEWEGVSARMTAGKPLRKVDFPRDYPTHWIAEYVRLSALPVNKRFTVERMGVYPPGGAFFVWFDTLPKVPIKYSKKLNERGFPVGETFRDGKPEKRNGPVGKPNPAGNRAARRNALRQIAGLYVRQKELHYGANDKERTLAWTKQGFRRAIAGKWVIEKQEFDLLAAISRMLPG